MNWVDGIYVFFPVILGWVGSRNGLSNEIWQFLTWIGAFILACLYYEQVGGYLASSKRDQYFLGFLSLMFLGILIGYLIQKGIHKVWKEAYFGALESPGGWIAGAAKGLVVVWTALIVSSYVNLPSLHESVDKKSAIASVTVKFFPKLYTQIQGKEDMLKGTVFGQDRGEIDYYTGEKKRGGK